jgi:YHS domain-containing protein
MFRFIILAAVGYIFYRALKSWMLGGRERPGSVDTRTRGEVDDVLVQDPVCKTYIPQRNSIVLQQGGETVHFCSEQCRERFLKDQSEPRGE